MKKTLLSFAALLSAFALNAATGPAPTNVRWEEDTPTWDLPTLSGDSSVTYIFFTLYDDLNEEVYTTSGSAKTQVTDKIFFPGMSYHYTIYIQKGAPGDWSSEKVTSPVHVVSGTREPLELPSVTLDINGNAKWTNRSDYYFLQKSKVTLQKKVGDVWTDLKSGNCGYFINSYSFGTITDPGTYRAVAENVQGSYSVTRGVSDELVVVKTRTVHFNGNGKISDPADLTIADGAVSSLPSVTDEKQTDRLLYWTRQSDGTGKWNFAKDTIKSDTTLYAQWLQWDLNLAVSETGCTWSIPVEAEGVVKGVTATLYNDKMTSITSTSSSGFSLVSTDFSGKMETGKKYSVVVKVEDLFGNTISDTAEYTVAPTAVDEAEMSQIFAANGRIRCDGEFRIYDILGRDVTRLNGSLNGVYIVKSNGKAVKVVVK